MIELDHLKLLEQKHPLLALQLKKANNGKKSGLDKKGMLSPNSLEGPGVLFIDRFSSLESIKDVSDWLCRGERKVVLIERAYEDVKAFLHLQEAGSLLKHPAFSCQIINECNEEFFFKTAWESLFLPSYFLSFDDKEFLEWKALMQHALDLTFLIASEYQDYGKKVAKNFYCNIEFLPNSHLAREFSFKGIPALICGAGPSIASQINMCMHLKNHALIFAGGALLSLCGKEGLNPHFGGLVDPDPPYERFKQASLFEMPTFYQMRTSHSILSLMHGSKILAASSGEFSLEQYFFSSVGISLPFLESGWNVANFMATLAAEMGCNPIILVGMDMSYEPDKEYLSGIEAVEEKKEVSVINHQGRKVLSRKDLLMGKTFFSHLVQKYPNQTFINATEAGLFIEGMTHKSLEEIEAELSLQYDLDGLVYAQKMEAIKLQDNKILFKKTIERLKESFAATLLLLAKLLMELEKSYMQQKDDLHKTFEEARVALEESDLEEEIVYQWILQPLWHVWRWVFFREQQDQIYTLEGKIKQVLFFEQVAKEHQALFHQIYSIRNKNL